MCLEVSSIGEAARGADLQTKAVEDGSVYRKRSANTVRKGGAMAFLLPQSFKRECKSLARKANSEVTQAITDMLEGNLTRVLFSFCSVRPLKSEIISLQVGSLRPKMG